MLNTPARLHRFPLKAVIHDNVPCRDSRSWALPLLKQLVLIGSFVKDFRTKPGSRKGQNLAWTGLFVPSSLERGTQMHIQRGDSFRRMKSDLLKACIEARVICLDILARFG